jgi:phage portal protein BeeE
MLADDAEFVEMSKTPVDMDFLNTMRETGKYVASAFGVPLPLIDNDASTFNNYEQAKERLYTDTVIPMMQEFIGALGHWMLPAYGDGLEFKLDLDSIPALEGLREKMFARSVLAFNPAMAAGMFDLPADELKALAYGLADLERK